MQLGMVGLGRMGANIVRRLMRDGHTCVVYDVNADAVAALAAEGATGADVARRLRREAASRRATCGSWCPAGEITEATVDELVGAARRRATPSSTAATRTTATTSAVRTSSPARGIHYLDVGTSGGVFGPRARLLPDDRRAGRAAFERLEPLFAHPRARRRRRRARRPGASGEPGARGARLPPLRPGRRRPLREDGAQRDRVRDDGRLRRGAEHPPARGRGLGRRREADAETAPARPSRVLPVRPRHPGRRRGVAPRQRRRVVAARPHGGRAAATRPVSTASPAACPTPARAAGRRSPRSRRASRAGAHRGALRALLVTGRGAVRNQVLSAMRHQFGGHDEKPGVNGRRLKCYPDAAEPSGAHLGARGVGAAAFDRSTSA